MASIKIGNYKDDPLRLLLYYSCSVVATLAKIKSEGLDNIYIRIGVLKGAKDMILIYI